MIKLTDAHTAEVDKTPFCELCEQLNLFEVAQYDGRTLDGSWAFMCEMHWEAYGPGETGLGRGQRLIVKGD